MGFDKDRRPLVTPVLLVQAERFSVINGASSAGDSIPRGQQIAVLVSTSTVAATPTIFYLPNMKVGDVVEAYCTLASSSAGACLRTSSSGQFIASSSLGWDQVQFFYTGVGVRLVAVSTSLWGCIGATTTASGTLPLLTQSTS